jgi:hypothetical protein
MTQAPPSAAAATAPAQAGPKPARSALWAAKLKAFAIHFSISVAVFAAVIAAMLEAFYPTPYFWVDGGLFVLTIAAIVDVGLGPSLTLVTYVPRHKNTRAILAAIAAAQIAALGAGVYLLYEHRPLAAAFVGYPRNEFFPVTKAMLNPSRDTLAKLEALSPHRPPLTYLELPEDREEVNRMLMEGLSGEKGVFQSIERYRPLQGEHLERVLAAGRTPQRIELVFFRENLRRIEDYVAAHGGRFESFAFVPLNGRYGRAMLVFTRSDGKLVATIPMKDIRAKSTGKR